MTLDQYIENISKRCALGNATEHTFRGDLQQLIETLVPGISATNEPKRIKCGAPDFVLMKREIPVGFIEAKDVGDKDLDGAKRTGNKEQFDRYKASLSNLIFTDYLDFHLYIDGKFITSVKIGEMNGGAVVPLFENFEPFANLIRDFASRAGQTIASSRKLAEIMAGKARILSDVIERSLLSDEAGEEDSTLKDQLTAFKDVLIHDITPKEFADVYAQTIAYGMFAARLHDNSLDSFSRQEAAELIPKSNPFLRKLFGYIAGPEIDDRIRWIVDSLADVFRAADIGKLLTDFGRSTRTHDPIIHFYETFLSEYDPKLRKSRGVWYTPEPVVNFIVRAVDDILKTEFNLPQGLADASKTKIKLKTQSSDRRFKTGVKDFEKEVHKVQILDPATGTGTFLAEVIKHIQQKFAGQQGIWSSYVENHLIPRLNGFELLMASYAMAHLKLDLLLGETGYKPAKNRRLHIYLTNSLEEHHPDTGTLWATWLSAEANEANHIKRDTPVMCVIGNPPYSGESRNRGKWIMDLMEDYKKEPGGRKKLNEANSKFINGDEYKFIRLAQHFIEKNGEGILAFINPHGFLDNPTFRGMRWHLLKTYDKIYVLDLHGNKKRKETSPDGSPDVNVFDIEQGVSINIFVKTGKKKENELGKVFHFSFFGKRELKYDFLLNNSVKTVSYKELPNIAPNYFFVEKNFQEQRKYESGFAVNDLFNISSLGFLTKRDELAIGFDKNGLRDKIAYFLDDKNSTEEVCRRFDLVLKDKDKWDAALTRQNSAIADFENFVKTCEYRPFDTRYVYYDPNFVARLNTKVLGHLTKENTSLIICRQGQAVGGDGWDAVFAGNRISDQNIYRRGGGTVFPLYLYPETGGQSDMFAAQSRTPNLNKEIVGRFASGIGLVFTPEKIENTQQNSPPFKAGEFESFAPIDILDYVYAVLHSPSYREKYKEFLKIDFPRVPFPKDSEIFWKLAELGRELREIHLLESAKVERYITQYPIDGDNKVGKIRYENGRVRINETQYFDNVPQAAWEFFIGGYQPAQKWLKDRKDRTLDYEDIFHYQKIIVALAETDRLMKEMNKIGFD